MIRYVVLCDCGQEVCRIDDDRQGSGQLDVKPTHVPRGGLVSVTGRPEDANRRGDHRSLHRLRCGVCPKSITPLRDSTIAAVLDRISDTYIEYATVVTVHESDRPATREDCQRLAAEFEAMLRGQAYEGEPARMVQVYGQRYAIPLIVFLRAVSTLRKDR